MKTTSSVCITSLLVLLTTLGCGKHNDGSGGGGSPDSGGGNVGNGDSGTPDGGSPDGGGDVSLVGPPVDPTIPATFSDLIRFIYDGEDPVQTGVVAGAIDDRRVIVLRGHVRSRDGQPVKDAVVTIVGAPEFGSTHTREDGWFDLAANGGGVVKVNVSAPGYFPVQRQAMTPWHRWVVLDEVVLTSIDPSVTSIASGGGAFQVHRGSAVTDNDGIRQQVLLFPPGLTAQSVLPDGGTLTLSNMHVRTTEYTSGSDGEAAMPAALPPTSAYTYAAEFTVDEAEAVGATTVRFSTPVIGYVDNFLNFPTGIAVPVGYYDRSEGAWKGSEDGRVLTILSTTNGLADIDLDGDGVADSSAVLESAGVTSAERATLASVYPSLPKSMWRITTSHFSAIDCNWPYGVPLDAQFPPELSPITDNRPEPDPHCHSGSIVECENQTLGESIALPGTDFSLVYRSDQGAPETGGTKIVLTGDSYPAILVGIKVSVDGAGRHYEAVFPPGPNLTYYFKWDGKDAYGRYVPGQQPFRARVDYLYQPTYGNPGQVLQAGSLPDGGSIPGNFGQVAAGPLAVRGRALVALTRFYDFIAGRFIQPPMEFGRWTLNIHHRYQADTNTLYRGDGQRMEPTELRLGATLILGGGTTPPADGVAGTDVNLMPTSPEQIIPTFAIGVDGTIYVTITARFTLDNYPITKIWGLGPDGTLKLVGGNDDQSIVFVRDLIARDQDDVDAKVSTFQGITGVATGPDRSIYVVQGGYKDQSFIIRRIGTDGVIRRFAGQRGMSGFSGDHGPAVEAGLGDPGVGLFADQWGNVYFPDTHRIRRVDPSGIISTYAFNGQTSSVQYGRFTAEGQPVRTASMSYPGNLVVADDGTMYVVGRDQVVRIGNDGIGRTFGGDLSIPDVPATSCDETKNSCFLDYLDVVSGQGLTLLANGAPLPGVRRVDPSGAVSAVTSLRTSPDCVRDGAPVAATCTDPVFMWGVGHMPSGELLIGASLGRLLRISPRPFENAIPSKDGSEIYQFDTSGRHLKTVFARTLATKYEFQYDTHGLLSAVIDGSGNRTVFQRDADGLLQTITSPFGIVTAASFDARGNLAQLKNALGNSTNLVTDENGLLTGLTDPRGFVHAFSYDGLGRLLKDQSPSGELVQLSREERVGKNYRVTKTSALGRVTTYDMSFQQNGRGRLTTDPAGLSEQTTWGSDGSVTSTSPDGLSATLAEQGDPRFGMFTPVPRSLVLKTPAGVTRTELTSIQLVDTTPPSRPLGFASLTEQRSVNGRTTTTVFDAATRRITVRSALGREVRTDLDVQERPVQQVVPGMLPVTYTYDGQGRIASMVQGSRTWQLQYDPGSGQLSSVVDPLGRTQTFVRDSIGRIRRMALPQSRSVGFQLDPSSNVTSLQVPSGASHDFSFTPENRIGQYKGPDVGGAAPAENFGYDLDGALNTTTLPDGRMIQTGRDSAGRVGSVVTDRTTVQMSYDPTTGRLRLMTDALASNVAPTGSSVGFSYDGPLLTSVSWAGAVTGTLTFSYNSDFLVASTSVSGTSALVNGYDDDLLLVGVSFTGAPAGALTLTRDPQNGLITGTSAGTLTTQQTWNAFGEVAGISASAGSSALYSSTLVSDQVGRIQQKVESVQGTSHTYLYVYDDADRLTDLSVDGAPAGHWVYDANGNRISGSAPGAPGTMLTGTYDAQDRIVSYGSNTYAFGASGDLKSKTVGGLTTSYAYDALGALSTVTLPSGDRVDYVLDAAGRRVGKKVNGVLQRGWLYDGLRPVAELDGSGAVIARFAYGTRPHVPDLIWKGGVVYRIVSDERGSPRLVVNTSNGQVVQRLDYDVWGNVLNDSAPGFQPFGFAGGLYDGNTKLTRFGLRDYDAETGRWTTKDPARFLGGSNLYVYAGNDPVAKIDPAGTELVLAVVGALAGAGVNALNAYVTHGDVGKAVAVGAVAGFVGGLFMNPWLGGAVAGGLTSFANRFGVNCENTLPWYVDVSVGAIAGAVGGGAGQWLGESVPSLALPIAASDFTGKLGNVLGGIGLGILANDGVAALDLLNALQGGSSSESGEGSGAGPE
jgi:RHS repeat-associated protein